MIEPGIPSRLVMNPGFFPSPSKRRRASAQLLVVRRRGDDDGNGATVSPRASIDALPDECLLEILGRLPGRRERSVCACVSKRWLMLLGTVCSSSVAGSGDSYAHQRRSLKGRGATDVRLAAMAIGAGSSAELLIQASRSTDVGLAAVSRGFPSLRVLSMWDCPLISDEGLVQIAGGCPLLEKLDLCKCPGISDRGIAAIASRCQKLSTLTMESCRGIGDRGLQAVGRASRNLRSISVADCPLMGDKGVVGLFSSPHFSTAQKIKLQSLHISDAALAVLGLHGKAVTELALAGLSNVTERGVWVMASAGGLRMLNHLSITSCKGLTDRSLEAAAQGFPLLKNIYLRRCPRLSDAGLKAFAAAAGSLESLQLDDCRRLSLVGVLDAILACRSSGNLKALSLAGCMGVKDDAPHPEEAYPSRSYPSLRSLTIRRCRGLGDYGLATVARLCPHLQHIDLCGNVDITGWGFRQLIENDDLGLATINLSGCANLADDAVSALAARHGRSLRVLNLEGCAKITDESLTAIADSCATLRDLDVSRCAVTDEGVVSLASSKVLDLQVLSLSGCQRISEHSVPYLSSLGQSLVGLGLQQCSSIGSHAMSALQNNMWWCDILC